MQVGDLVKYVYDTGIVLDILEKRSSTQALVLWQDGKTQWVACVMCEVISEGR